MGKDENPPRCAAALPGAALRGGSGDGEHPAAQPGAAFLRSRPLPAPQAAPQQGGPGRCAGWSAEELAGAQGGVPGASGEDAAPGPPRGCGSTRIVLGVQRNCPGVRAGAAPGGHGPGMPAPSRRAAGMRTGTGENGERSGTPVPARIGVL